MTGNKFTYFRRMAGGCILFFLLTAFRFPHPFHVSLTEIKFKSAPGTVEISCRMFTDDLQQAVRRLYLQKADLRKAPDDETVNRFLFQYITGHLSIEVNAVSLQPRWVGYENEEEFTWCYLECSSAAMPGTVKIINTLLFDQNTGQVNMIHCYLDEERKSTKLDQPESEAYFSF